MNNSNKNPSASLALGHAVCMASLALAVQQAYAATDSTTLDTVKVNADQRNDALAPTRGYQVGSSKSASKTDTPLQDIPQAVSVVTRQQIEDQQARTISEALNYTPGCLPAQ
jgi:iron complex outermembrane receptor protein